VRIDEIEIGNILTYERGTIPFESYNVIVGPNASGKTNIIRILDLIGSSSSNGITDKRLNRKLKLNKNHRSFLKIKITLSPSETRILFQIFTNRVIDSQIDEALTRIHLLLEWQNVHDSDPPPDSVVLYFENGLIMWNEASKIYISHINKISRCIDNLKSILSSIILIDNNTEKKEKYYKEKGFDYLTLFGQPNFQNDLLSGGDIGHFFNLEDQKIRTHNPFSVSFSPTESTNDQKELGRRIFSEFLNSDLSRYNSTSLWLLIDTILSNVTIQKEIHLSIDEIATQLYHLKNVEGVTSKYDLIRKEFSDFFPNVSFDARVSSLGESQAYITIIEIDPITKQNNEFHLQDSASGYYETLSLLLEKWSRRENVLILDEPALHLYPTKIRYLSRILATSERQIVLATHSPYFVDISMFGPGRNLIYIKRNNDGKISKITNKFSQNIQNSGLQIKGYLFNPDIFFANCNILVEGQSDANVFCAISDVLNSVFERYGITVVDVGGVEYIDTYAKFTLGYEIPYVTLVDNEYEGGFTSSDDFVILSSNLEGELANIGLNVGTHLCPNEAYERVLDAMQNKKMREKIHLTDIGKVFDMALKKAGIAASKEIWQY
jgi:energy-coupling factor transporter ATP-binding protein EcfA2